MTDWKRILEKVDDQRWLLPQEYKQGMRVPGLSFASEELLDVIGQDKAIEQVANVAFLPGIVRYSLAMPDIHWGYGFCIGGVAATDPANGGVISPGGVGYDINCGVRLLRTDITLDEHTILRRSPEIEHERRVAIFDLLEENHFDPLGLAPGPYHLHLAIEDNRLVLDIRAEDESALARVVFPVSPRRRLIKDYFHVCESYFDAVKRLPPSRIETIDMGRRGIHNEGAQILAERLEGKIETDYDTARRLFTVICALQFRG